MRRAMRVDARGIVATLALVSVAAIAEPRPDEPTAPPAGCPGEVWGIAEPASPVTSGTYPRAVRARPMTAPDGLVAVTLLAGWQRTIDVVTSPSGPVVVTSDAVSAALAVNRGFGCRVELGFFTAHQLLPGEVVPGLGLELRVGLIPGGMALLVRLQPPAYNSGGTLFGGVLLGLPTRYALTSRFALLALDRLLVVSVVSFAGGTNGSVGLALPAGLLVQPHEAVAIVAQVRPQLLSVGIGQGGLRAFFGTAVAMELSVAWAASRHLEFSATGYLSLVPNFPSFLVTGGGVVRW